MRRCVIRSPGLGEIERGGRHAERAEHAGLHGFVVRRAQLAPRVKDGAAEEAGRGGGHVGVLEDLAESAGRAHRGEEIQDAFRGRAQEREDPVGVLLVRQAGAHADEVLHRHLGGQLCVSELERRVDARDLGVPGELAFIHELGEQQRGQGLRVRCDHEEGVGGDGRSLADLTHAEATLEDDGVRREEAHGDTGDAGLEARGFHELRERPDARGVEGVGGPAPERLSRVAGGPQAVDDDPDLRGALGERRLAGGKDHDRPRAASPEGPRRVGEVLVRRGLVPEPAILLPAIARGPVHRDLDRPLEVGNERRPCRGDGDLGGVGLPDIDEGEVDVWLRPIEQAPLAVAVERPAGGRCERRARRRRPRQICGELLRRGGGLSGGGLDRRWQRRGDGRRGRRLRPAHAARRSVRAAKAVLRIKGSLQGLSTTTGAVPAKEAHAQQATSRKMCLILIHCLPPEILQLAVCRKNLFNGRILFEAPKDRARTAPVAIFLLA